MLARILRTRYHPGIRASGTWLAPLASAAAVVAMVLGSVLVVGNLGRSAGTAPTSGATGAPPEFYLALHRTSQAPLLEVHRTADGAVTDSEDFPGIMLLWGSLAADASDRAFYIATFPTCTEATPVTRFYRFTINNSGKFSGYQTVGSPVTGTIASYAVSPSGSQVAYTIKPGWCEGWHIEPGPPTAIHVMDLSTGAVRTWQNTATTQGPGRVNDLFGGLSWTPDGRTVIAMTQWGRALNDISVLGLNTSGAGGSIQASSHVLLTQDQNCVTCLQEAIAGPGNTLTALEVAHGRQLVVRISPQSRHPQRVLYSAAAPPARDLILGDLNFGAVIADPSGQWVITWPPIDETKRIPPGLHIGWIRDGKLVSLPGPVPGHSNQIAW